MRMHLDFGVVALAPFLLSSAVQAQKKEGIPAKDPIAATQRLLETTQVDPAPFRLALPLSDALKRIDTALSAKRPTRLDGEAFGADEQRIAKTLVQFDKKRKSVPALELLDNLLGQVRKTLNVDVDLGIRPDRLLITTPRLAAYEVSHEIADLVPETDRLARNSGLKEGVGKGSAEDRLLRLLTTLTEPRAFESLQIFNGKSLLAHATPVKQRDMRELIESLRRIADVAVVMDARLFEVERTFFVQHAAPLFIDEKAKSERSIALIGDGPLLERLSKLKPIARSVDDMLKGGRAGLVVSVRQAVKTFKSRPGDDPAPGKEEPETLIVGVVVDAVTNVSPDRRFIELEIRQKITEIGGPRRVRFGDPEFGFEEAEQPPLKKMTLSSGVRIPDGASILVHVPYHPPHAPERVWLLLAQPRIFIQEEEDAIRKGVLPPPPR